MHARVVSVPTCSREKLGKAEPPACRCRRPTSMGECHHATGHITPVRIYLRRPRTKLKYQPEPSSSYGAGEGKHREGICRIWEGKKEKKATMTKVACITFPVKSNRDEKNIRLCIDTHPFLLVFSCSLSPRTSLLRANQLL